MYLTRSHHEHTRFTEAMGEAWNMEDFYTENIYLYFALRITHQCLVEQQQQQQQGAPGFLWEDTEMLPSSGETTQPYTAMVGLKKKKEKRKTTPNYKFAFACIARIRNMKNTNTKSKKNHNIITRKNVSTKVSE